MRDRCDYAHAAETLTADMPRVTPAGVTFLAPSDWSEMAKAAIPRKTPENRGDHSRFTS
jgi:hypothetical protein